MKPVETKAIELMQMDGVLRFSKEGLWTHDAEPVTHQGVARYFSKHLRFDTESQRYVVAVGSKAVAVEVEDTALVVMAVFDQQIPWRVLLSDGSEEEFSPRTLSLRGEAEDGLYCEVRGVRARLRRVAAQSISKHIQERGGQIGLLLGDEFFPLTNK